MEVFMRKTTARLGWAFLKGSLAAIAIHGAALLSIKSGEAGLHFIGHVATVIALQIGANHS
jgi:hypothetical protein